MHLDRIMNGVTPRTGTSGAGHEVKPIPLGLDHPGKRGQRRATSGKKTPGGSHEKGQTKKEARGLDHLGRDVQD